MRVFRRLVPIALTCIGCGGDDAPIDLERMEAEQVICLEDRADLGDKAGQVLPSPDMEGFQAFVRAEIARREAAR